MKLNSANEWDKLREVVLGSAENLSAGLDFPRSLPPENLEKAIHFAKQAYPKWYCDEVREDLADLEKILKDFGAVVKRPHEFPAEQTFATPDWQGMGKDTYNVRDIHLVVGNTVIVGPSPERFRFFEPLAFQRIWNEYFEQGCRWITAPKPRLLGEYRTPYQRGKDTFHRLSELEILFDAANVIRLGQDLLYLVSSTGNQKGARWLQSVLGDEYKVHLVNAYGGSHLDSTILPLRPGLVLINSARITRETLPDVLRRWDPIYFEEVAPVPDTELDFHTDVRKPLHQKLLELGVNSNLNHMSSPWAGLNILSLDPQTVLVHDRQTALIKELERNRLTVIPVRLRHCYTMLGGLHCTTLDTVREN